MAKKDIREKKNQEAKRTFLREAAKLGFKETDPEIKESIENIVNVKGSSVGRDKLIEQQLLKLKENLDVRSGKIVMTNEELQKLIDEKVQEATSEISKNNEELIERLVNEKLGKLTEAQTNEILSKLEEFSQPVYVFNNYIERESLLHKAYDATKETVSKVKDATVEKASKIKDATVNAMGKAKDTTVETVNKVKDATVETVNKVKDATVETASKVKDATVETASKAKDTAVETATRVKDVTMDAAEKGAQTVISFGTSFKENAINQKNKQINHVLTFFEKIKENTKEVKSKLEEKVNEHKEKKALEKERKALEKEKKALERERRLVERELKNAQKEKELYEKEKDAQEIDSPEQDNDVLDAIFKTRLMDKSREIAYAYGIDFDDESIRQKVSDEIDRIGNYEDLSKKEDVIGHITGKIENLYKEHNIEIMKQKREAEKQKAPEVKEPEIKEPEVKEPEVEDVREFLFGSEKTGFRYIEQEDGTIQRIFINGGKEQSVTTVSREEYEDRKERYLNSSNNEEVAKDNEVQKNKDVDMAL